MIIHIPLMQEILQDLHNLKRIEEVSTAFGINIELAKE